ncbi:tyrosine-type recombinase/integrase [Mesorhizobium sp. B4-1-4]|uniref:tyrosine-type recombinase/integrase n=1 Tax=Mesorhizobium sp. B4-1-4 TaxID=2589888 RepID=UPI00112E3B66|nr:site-specific integrase [Mesorhizobium sp. B4-1-4]UCI30516.1 tyrosine-type recombinase/integrase [Mesorhizobium sp. B4-1-4]
MTTATRKKGLSPRTLQTLIEAAEPGLWAHRFGLSLAIAKSGTATWTFRYGAQDGKRRLMTLETINSNEPITAASLKALELQAEGLRLKVRQGHDPLAARNAAANKPERNTGPRTDTFENVARDYIAQHEGDWKNDKHRQQWSNTLSTYVYAKIGSKAPHEITTEDVLDVLQQDHTRNGKTGSLWKNARETASRVRSRIEIVIGAAKAKGLSNPATRHLWAGHVNPAAWNDNLEHWLNGKQSKSHFAAMDWKDVPAFVAELREKTDYSAKALLLTILSAVRTSECLNATWGEFDLEAATWTIPAERMKAGKEHRVPLSSAAIELVKALHRIEDNPYVFPGAKRNQPLSNMAMLEMLRGMRDGLTVHGFRSAFRDWCSETTLHPDTIAEMALAHTVKDKTVKAYLRKDAFERRKNLMQQWEDYLLLDREEYNERWSKFIA